MIDPSTILNQIAPEARLQSVLQSMPDFVVTVGRDGSILLINRTVLGVEEKDAIGTSIFQWTDPRDHEVLQAAIDQVIECSENIELETRGVGDNGEPAVYRTRMGPVIHEGKVVALTIVARDITQQLRLSEIAHATRLNTLGEMLGGLAHELNQPLTAICNFADVCARHLESKDDAHLPSVLDDVKKIGAQGQRAAEIIRDLKRMVRKSEPQHAETEVVEVVQSAVSLVSPEAQLLNIEIQIDLSDDLPAVKIDRIQIEQVLINLIRNSFDASGELDVKRIHVAANRKEDDVVISVSDNGPGIHKDDMPKIFDAFYTTKSSGMGMGLAISQTITRAHRGRLWAEPNNPQGAVFHLSLPATQGVASAAQAHQSV